MSSKIIVCTGGARSGKSEFAERLALSLYNKEKEYTDALSGQSAGTEGTHLVDSDAKEESLVSSNIKESGLVSSTIKESDLRQLGIKEPGLLYVATGQAFDDEMKGRIANHQHRRGDLWETLEVPHELGKNWSHVLAQKGSVILLDCLTMYVTNVLLMLEEPYSQEQIETLQHALTDEFTRIIEATRAQHKTLIMVTNEVGSGIVPGNALSRHFRDVAGFLNQQVAAMADEVYLTVSGITIEIKSKEVRI